MSTLTIFSWGYWGWGTSTKQFVKLVDAIERERGYNPPIFMDCRKSRSVRAPGFRENEFRDLVGSERYVWMRPFGNPNVGSKKRKQIRNGGYRISDPSAADIFLHFAQQAAKDKRRLIFFCQCQYIRWEGKNHCHRSDISHLLLKSARKANIALNVVEWPGSEPADLEIPLPRSSFSKVKSLSSSVPLPKKYDPSQLQGPGWGSIVKFTSGDESIYRLVGPVQWRHSRWNLPIVQWYRDPVTEKPIYRAESKRMIKSRGWAERRA